MKTGFPPFDPSKHKGFDPKGFGFDPKHHGKPPGSERWGNPHDMNMPKMPEKPPGK